MKILLTCANSPSFPPSPTPVYLQTNARTNHINKFNPKDFKPINARNVLPRVQPSIYYFNLYLQLYVNAGAMEEARNLFDKMPERTLISWTILMSGYAKQGPVYETLKLFIDLLCYGLVWADAFVYSVVLRACSEVKDLNLGCGVHAQVLKRGDMVDSFVENALVNMYASCGSLDDAILIFEGIEMPTLVAWSSILSGYLKNGLEEEGLRIFLGMICSGVELDAYVFSMVIKGCADLGDFDFGKQIHCYMLKMGFVCCLFLENSLMDFYAKCGDIGGLRRVFDGMSARDLVSWNTLIMGYVHNILYFEALRIFRDLMERVSDCDVFTLTTCLKAIASLGNLDLGREVHGYVIRVGLDSNHHLIGSLLDMYIVCINHDTLNPLADVPIKLYYNFEGRKFDGYFIASMLKWCSLQSNLEIGKTLHSLTIKLDLNSDPYVISSLIDMYNKCGLSKAALRVFLRVKEPGITTWSPLISGFCLNSWYLEALCLFRRMQFECVEANEFAFTSVLLACLAMGDLQKAKEVHCKMLRTGYETNASVVNMLINLYSTLWHYEQALKLCTLITDVEISWNSLIKACVEAEDYEMAHKLLGRIQKCHGSIDVYSACDILNSCANPMLLNVGTQAHAYMTKRGLISHPTTGNFLIDMYSQCGNVVDANLAFRSMHEKNSLSWTSIISAKVNHGRPSEALKFFKVMQQKNSSMDPSTFNSALKAYALTGMTHEAYNLLMSMEKVYGIVPSEEHYSLIVEALGRAGMFEEVEEFIKQISPIKLGPLVWRTLLLCSRLYGNMQVAKYALEKLVEYDPSDSIAHLQLKQVLLILGKWNYASKLKGKNKIIRTNSSWIEIQNKIYEFVCGESPTNEVRNKLAEMEEKMKEMGFEWNRKHMVLEEEEYKGVGLHHTEMKAIATGLISLPHGTAVRVVKNVRMCGYCHSACKFMSTFVERELVVKDSCTFHHFVDGKCSCRDAW